MNSNRKKENMKKLDSKLDKQKWRNYELGRDKDKRSRKNLDSDSKEYIEDYRILSGKEK